MSAVTTKDGNKIYYLYSKHTLDGYWDGLYVTRKTSAYHPNARRNAYMCNTPSDIKNGSSAQNY